MTFAIGLLIASNAEKIHEFHNLTDIEKRRKPVN
jgi:hypothetical protein